MRVLHLPLNIASQTSVTVRALQQVGVEARGIIISSHVIQSADGLEIYSMETSSRLERGILAARRSTPILAAIRWADVVHYHFDASALPRGLDLRWVRLLKKPGVAEFWGSDIRIPEVDHPVRIVILWGKRNDQEAKKILLCNRTHWEVTRILSVYRWRWRGTECFHRDGKQHLGMGDCQLRSGRGQTRHLYLVFLAHSVLMRQLRQGRACEWARERLTTIGQACMSVLRQTLGDTISWAIDRIENDGWNVQRVKVQLALT